MDEVSEFEKKREALDILRRRYREQSKQLQAIDGRLDEYYREMCQEVTEETDAYAEDCQPYVNYREILGGIKFLRLLRSYEFDAKKVRQVIRLREGEWRKDRKGLWRHVSGGLDCPGTTAPRVYRWEPFQVFVLASVFGFHAWIDTQLSTADRDTLLGTEEVRGDEIYDLRRLCVDFVLYMARKGDKTGMAAYIAFIFFLLEDFNAEIYCTANASDQSKILYRRIRDLLAQVRCDANGNERFRLTETVCDWKQQYKSIHDSSIRPLSAGGKTKDGMFAQLCCADEYGSAEWVNGKSDMKRLVDVVQSSMGPRREPMTFTTTTAGRIQVGPFIEKLEALHKLLEKEIEYEKGTEQPILSTDRMLCLCLEPDEWEKRDEEYLLTSHAVRRKTNKMLGKIVQHQFYDDEIAKARLDGDIGEVVAKLFNVYAAKRKTDWVKAERIRQLQVAKRIEDCKYDDGWDVYVGMDFSQGNDLHAATYLGVRWKDDGSVEYFADMDAWINEKTLRESSIRDLYQLWIDKGYLRVSEGDVFQPNLPVVRCRQLDDEGINFLGFGYDANLSKDPVNELKAWLQTIGADPDKIVVPIGQTNASFNPAVDRLTFLLGSDEVDFHLSDNPLWPFEFGNVAIDEDLRMGNKKPIKRSQSDACKVDNVQCLCMCFLLEETLGA